ncbi:hypothetical protein [Streptomyces sp. KN37]|uniref:hypothetical protein n=1 Tax=Streptomyces sp. KN37 TaxID=3090667 RepID=UPI002A7571B8|nr:hypothetical protein [Streptomyces sp. KN37]WPO74001.1 hypothetical protein R9806_26970 [Streptomyces sp. KN37]
MYRDDDSYYYAEPVAGRNYVELSPRSALYVPTAERFWNRDDKGKPLRGWDAPTALYRLLGADGLLYVGIGVQPEGRWQDHKHTKAWWADVLVKTVDWHANRAEAEIAEYYAIRRETPRYNAQLLIPQAWYGQRIRAITEMSARWGARRRHEGYNAARAAA